MRVSQRGIDLIKKFEGLELTSYEDAAGVLTIGYGHTGEDVKPGDVISKEQAEKLLRRDLEEAEQGVNRNVTVPLTQNQFDALVSFTYNLGTTALANSTLLRELNKGRYESAAAQFERWVYAGGKKLKGLIRRRIAEKQLFQNVHN